MVAPPEPSCRCCFSVFAAGAGLASAASHLPDLKAERWVNSGPLTPEALRGKVVLVNFWEFTCINWIRTSPYVKAWNRDYAKFGLVVIGVHAPEFEFGKRAENIDRGIRDHGLTYPIAIDNDFVIWQRVRQRCVAGEIPLRRARETGESVDWRRKLRPDRSGDPAPSDCGQPGDKCRQSARGERVCEDAACRLTPGSLAKATSARERRERGMFKLEGDWRSDGQFVELQKGTGTIVLPFIAGEVNLVVQPGPSGKSAMTVLLDGKPIGEARGADVGTDGVARFDRSGMIRLVAGAPRREARSDPGRKRSRPASVRVHLRALGARTHRRVAPPQPGAERYESICGCGLGVDEIGPIKIDQRKD